MAGRFLVIAAFAALFAVVLGGCRTTTDATGLAPAKALACDTYGKGLTYDTTKDSNETIRGNKVKNNAFAGIGCDLVKGGVKE